MLLESPTAAPETFSETLFDAVSRARDRPTVQGHLATCRRSGSRVLHRVRLVVTTELLLPSQGPQQTALLQVLIDS
jgi:hypothetical protein